METISNKQGFTLAITFLLCNCFSILFGTSSGADIWISYILASFLAILIWWLLCASFEKHGFNSFFEMLEFTFGKVVARPLSILLLIYALLSAASSMALFTEFTQLTALTKTPQIVLPLILLVLAAWALKSGLGTLSHGATILFCFALFTFGFFLFFCIPQLDIKNALPILSAGFLPVAKSALSVFVNQFGDVILLFCIYPHVAKNKSRKPTMLFAVITSTLLFTVIALFTLLTLGGKQINFEYFPVFTILSIRNVGSYIQHMEILTSIAMTFFIFVRQTIYLYFSALAIGHITKTNFKSYLLPLAFVVICATRLLYWNMLDFRARMESNLNLYILLPIQLLFPCIIGSILAIKRKKEK